MLAFLAAEITSSILTSLSLSPYSMFSLIDLSKSTGSWDTMPSLDLNIIIIPPNMFLCIEGETNT